MNTLRELAAALAAGLTTSRALTEECLAAIADPAGEGQRAFLTINADAARAMADAVDSQRRVGRASSPYAGIPFSLKDLFDVEGQVTTAGSVVLKDQPSAIRTAPVVARMIAAGFVPVAITRRPNVVLRSVTPATIASVRKITSGNGSGPT